MALKFFISYAHADEKALDRLHKHLAMMRREGSLESWDDRVIKPGAKLDDQIKQGLESANIFLALVSPDYLSSNYCYEREFEYALQLEAKGRIRIVPVILEPCDWLSSPLARHLALPKDGQPISQWTNQNNAYLDVVNGLRSLANEAYPEATERSVDPQETPRRGIRVKRDFDAIDKSDFADKAFTVIRDYFRNSCEELNQIGDGLRAKFETMNETAFTCTVVNRAKIRGGEANITVHNQKGRQHFGDITYSYQRYADSSTSNGFLSVSADQYNLFLSNDFGLRRDEQKTSPEQAAENLWKEFVERAGVEYE